MPASPVYRDLLLLILCFLQHGHLFASSQSFAELEGAGSILPYSGTSSAVRPTGVVVDPTVLNIYPQRGGGPGVNQGPTYVGPMYTNMTTRSVPGPVNTSGGGTNPRPVFHFVFGNTPGVLGPSQRPTTGEPGVGGRLLDPPNRSSLWRYRLPGAPINFRDNNLDCGADQLPVPNQETDDQLCGVCGDSPIGPQSHVMGGRYVRQTPYVSRTYTSGSMIPVTFLLNRTILPGTDMVTFSLCPIRQPERDITWGCGGQGGSLKVFGWANRYMPVRSGVHRVTLQLPQGFTCSRCVLQWRWRTSYRRSRRECSSTPWLWACYNNVQYINCADIAITSPYNNPWPYVLLAGS